MGVWQEGATVGGWFWLHGNDEQGWGLGGVRGGLVWLGGGGGGGGGVG